MPRAVLVVLDSLGVGAAEDAAAFGDAGANTLGHVAEACADGRGDAAGLRQGPLHIPNLLELGLGAAAEQAAGRPLPLPRPERITALYGYAAEQSAGKDTPSGHWELAGQPALRPFAYFPKGPPSFPPELVAAFLAETGAPGILGDRHASGTAILDELGEAHIATGKPILYTSGDSVLQIAAHEVHYGLDRLYRDCAIARRLVDAYAVGRVIARPFIGERAGEFRRTGGRKDYTTPPPGPTLLDRCRAAGGDVIGIGKIYDIFAGQGISATVKPDGDQAVFDALLQTVARAPNGALVFANFSDLDTLYGHRRNLAGYAAALEAIDRRIPDLRAALRPGDLAAIAADHGNDPSWPGSDHTREFIPLLVFGPGLPTGPIGRRGSFADLGQSVARHLGLAPLSSGVSFLQ